MGIFDQVSDALKKAMKEQNKDRMSVIRMVLSELKYAKTAAGVGDALSDSEALKAIGGYYKRLEKALADFPEQGKAKLMEELKIVSEFLPAKASPEEIKKAIQDLLAKAKDKQFGPLMKELTQKFGTAADGKTLSQMLKDMLK